MSRLIQVGLLFISLMVGIQGQEPSTSTNFWEQSSNGPYDNNNPRPSLSPSASPSPSASFGPLFSPSSLVEDEGGDDVGMVIAVTVLSVFVIGFAIMKMGGLWNYYLRRVYELQDEVNRVRYDIRLVIANKKKLEEAGIYQQELTKAKELVRQIDQENLKKLWKIQKKQKKLQVGGVFTFAIVFFPFLCCYGPLRKYLLWKLCPSRCGYTQRGLSVLHFPPDPVDPEIGEPKTPETKETPDTIPSDTAPPDLAPPNTENPKSLKTTIIRVAEKTGPEAC